MSKREIVAKVRSVQALADKKDKETAIALIIELDSFLDNFLEVYNLT